jgi:uncharacterized SAM-binding protein YcdF (DUF218 family)
MRTLAGLLSQPLIIALLLGITAAMFGMRRHARKARVTAVLAVLVVWLGGSEVVANLLIGGLDRRYPALVPDMTAGVRYIAVLGSGYSPAPGVSAVGALDADGLARVMEALTLARHIPEVTLVLSGGAPPGRDAPARGYERLVRVLDGDRWPLLVSDTPLDTAAEARELRARLGDASVIVVTSNYHVPRAMMLMHREGVRARPAPAGRPVIATLVWSAWIPSAAGLRKTQLALHEYLGILAIRMGLV